MIAVICRGSLIEVNFSITSGRSWPLPTMRPPCAPRGGFPTSLLHEAASKQKPNRTSPPPCRGASAIKLTMPVYPSPHRFRSQPWASLGRLGRFGKPDPWACRAGEPLGPPRPKYNLQSRRPGPAGAPPGAPVGPPGRPLGTPRCPSGRPKSYLINPFIGRKK